MRIMRCSQFNISKKLETFFLYYERTIYQKVVLKNCKFAESFPEFNKIIGKSSFSLVNEPIEKLNC